MQKKLLRYLVENTSNQYFITTHSSHIMDTEGAAVFHVYLEDGQSIVEPAESSVDKTNICADLGYRASDLMQSNAVIWVEGPSDRIYLNHWISKYLSMLGIGESLIEGIHYSIMFYGGRLLSHLTGEDPQQEDSATVEQFISLRRLNRYSVLVLDRDRDNGTDPLNATKSRLCTEFEKDPAHGFAWVTAGREIENYIPEAEFSRIITELGATPSTYGKFNRITRVTRQGKTEKVEINKVDVARRVAESSADFNQYDLQKRMNQLVHFINRANGLDEIHDASATQAEEEETLAEPVIA